VPRTRRQLLAAAATLGAAAYVSRQPSKASRADGPNILLVIIDTLRVDHVFGPRARTPNMDALAAQGLRFTRFFPEAMPTVPTRNSILSGRRMFPFWDWHDYKGLIAKPGWEPLDEVDSAFPVVLGRAGWWTAMVTDNPFLGFSSPYEPLRRSFDLFIRHGGQIGGRDGPVDRDKLAHWIHPAVRRAGMEERVRRYIANADYSDDESRSFAAQVFRSAIRALDVGARKAPFLLVVDAYEPHEPWTPPRRYVDMFGDPDYRGPEPAMPRYGRVENWLSDDEAELVLDRMRALYAAEVTMTDHWLGALLERLRELHLDSETAIVLVSDHGVQLGEHGWVGKISAALHPELIHPPLVVAGGPVGATSEWFASSHDIAPTLLALAGVEPPRRLDGADLLSEGVLPERPFAYGGYSDHHFVRDRRWAYMADNGRRSPLLFDLEADPGETRNVAGLHRDVVERQYALLRERVDGDLPSYE
jgi:arylsulfatase A-like enzyme